MAEIVFLAKFAQRPAHGTPSTASGLVLIAVLWRKLK